MSCPRNWLNAASLPAVACSLYTLALSSYGTHTLATILTASPPERRTRMQLTRRRRTHKRVPMLSYMRTSLVGWRVVVLLALVGLFLGRVVGTVAADAQLPISCKNLSCQF